jgi:hypothetical protein
MLSLNIHLIKFIILYSFIFTAQNKYFFTLNKSFNLKNDSVE